MCIRDRNGAVETVHVKNTGRCKELLLPGTAVRLEVSDNPKRKTKYDLVAVHKQGLGWVNMDSQAPNKVVGEWLAKQGYDYICLLYTSLCTPPTKNILRLRRIRFRIICSRILRESFALHD